MGENNENLREIHMIGASTQEWIVHFHSWPSLTGFGIGLCGRTDARGEFQFVRHRPRTSQLLVCRSGWGQVLLDGEWVRCGPGTAYVTPPGVRHAYRAVHGQPWGVGWVIFNPWQGGKQPVVGFETPTLLEVDADPLFNVLDGLYKEANGSATPDLLRLWTELLYAQSQRMVRADGIDARLMRLWKTVGNNLAKDWSVERLAGAAGTSGEHLRRLCQQHLNSSPMRHVTLLRMRHAAALLASDSYSVEDVAQQVGYENTFAFSTAFRRVLGDSPTGYRKRVLDLNREEASGEANGAG